MSAQVIRLADHRRDAADRPLAAHQAELLLAPYRPSVGAAVAIVVSAIASWCLVFFPLLWLAS